jgi:GDP-L-fucose synthase
MNKSARIFIAGHTGLIGSALMRRLTEDGFSNLITVSHDSLDLTNFSAVDDFFQKNSPEYVVLAAGKVGGIIENQNHPAKFISQNLAIQQSTMCAADKFGVRKFIFLGSSCMYPRICAQPMSEGLLLTGVPESTSMAYAISKLAGLQACLAFNQERGKKYFIPLIPNSAYGPNDNFDPMSGHVLSALIRRFHEAKLQNLHEISLWGTGNPRREFVHADDIASACLLLMTESIENLELPLNLGSGCDFSIRELADITRAVVGFDGDVNWDTSKPDGAPRKLLDSKRMFDFGWRSKVSLEHGIRDTYAWFKKNKAS